MSPEHAVILSLSVVSYLLLYHISTHGVVLETHANEKFVRIMLFIFNGLRHQGAGIVG